MWDLTVPGNNDHDFYVLAGSPQSRQSHAGEYMPPVEILVHNNTPCTPAYGPFHRLESPTQTPETAGLQQQNGELWGKTARYSSVPSVKAYNGPLPDGARGVEFYTDVPPSDVSSGAPGDIASWRQGYPGVTNVNDEWVKITCLVTKNTQC
jgi:hypothetical protein